MPTYHILYNPLAGNGTGHTKAETLKEVFTEGELSFHDITKLDINKFISENVTQTIKNQRQENREKFAAYGNMEITAQRKNNNKVLTKKEARDNMQKAINLVEGNDELSL